MIAEVKMLTPERLAATKARHVQIAQPEWAISQSPCCAICGTAWPCDAIYALTALEHAQRRLAWLEEKLIPLTAPKKIVEVMPWCLQPITMAEVFKLILQGLAAAPVEPKE